jgi:hypothetical protein
MISIVISPEGKQKPQAKVGIVGAYRHVYLTYGEVTLGVGGVNELAATRARELADSLLDCAIEIENALEGFAADQAAAQGGTR